MTTYENSLSQQELREADRLCVVWLAVNAEARSLLTVSADIEETFLVCYGRTREKSSMVSDSLQSVVDAADQIIVLSHEWNARLMVQDVQRTSALGSPPPMWYQRGLKELTARFDQIASKRGASYQLINLLTNSIGVVPLQQIIVALHFLQDNSHELDGIENDMRNTRKAIAALMAKKTAEFAKVRAAVFDALCAWAGASEARVAYLKSKGVAVVTSAVQCVVDRPASPGPARSLRRQKRQKVAEIAVVRKPNGEAEAEKPWQVICVNGLGNQLCSFPLMLSGDGEYLAKELHQYFKWMNVVRNAQQRTMEKLRNLLNAAPALRNNGYGTYAFAEEMFYRLRIGKGRIMVRPDDQARTIKILAGHKTEAMKEIGQRHNEA